jgi:molybdenum cofactor cytidylyltransferase
MNIGCLILAAGSSSRLGRPKQLLKYNQKTLIENTISTVLAAEISPIYVALGSDFELIRDAIHNCPVKIIHHHAWQEGIGSSIRTGISYMENENHFDAILIMLCDQPHIGSEHLKDLIRAFSQKEKSIIATGYGKHTGVPALFDRKIFPSLKELSGDKGAKDIINKNSDDIYVINFEQAAIDIDTPEDFNNL